MKKVGIIGRFGEIFDKSAVYMFENYRLICFQNGVMPVMILPPQCQDYVKTSGEDLGGLSEKDKEYLKDCIDACDGIIIPGGERWYDFDKFIYEYAYLKDKPILGICMGMQLMISCDTGDMPLENELNNHYQKKTDYAHFIKLNPDTKLFSIMGKAKLMVNSFHNYHMDKTNHLKVSASSKEGYIEAIEDPTKKFVVGVQWHPEMMYDYDLDNQKLMKAFISAL